MNAILTWLKPKAKAAASGAVGSVLALLSVGTTDGFTWKAIVAAAVTGALSALGVYVVPNKPKRR